MVFLAEYSLFFLKAITIVVAFLFLIGGILILTRKNLPSLQIISLSDEYGLMQARMLQQVKGEKKKKNKKDKKRKDKAQESVYVIDFFGDSKASQVEQLRDEISAVLSVAKPQDEVVIRLESPGGVVNGYGLAASQLQRIKAAGIPLTVCIDKVAASGGYLMSCVADKMIAAPFSIIGSIGVVMQLPNFHRWLKDHHVDIELITAGQYKRTLTLLGENTEKGRQKCKEDIEKVYDAFKQYVLKERPHVDIDKVATGEYWLGVDAFKLQLIDILQTSDDYLAHKMEKMSVYQIKQREKRSLVDKVLKPVTALWTQFSPLT